MGPPCTQQRLAELRRGTRDTLSWSKMKSNEAEIGKEGVSSGCSHSWVHRVLSWPPYNLNTLGPVRARDTRQPWCVLECFSKAHAATKRHAKSSISWLTSQWLVRQGPQNLALPHNPMTCISCITALHRACTDDADIQEPLPNIGKCQCYWDAPLSKAAPG